MRQATPYRVPVFRNIRRVGTCPTEQAGDRKILLFSDQGQLDGGVDVGVQVKIDFVVAGDAESPVGQHHFTLLQFLTGIVHRFGDVAGADGTEQTALLACLAADADLESVQLGLASFSRRQLVRGLFLQFGAAGLENLPVLFGGGNRLAGRNQKVTAVTILDMNLVAQVTQVIDFLQQNNIHCNHLV